MSVTTLPVAMAVLCAFVLSGDTQVAARTSAAPEKPPTRTLRPVTNFVTVTDQIIRVPKREDWLIYRGNY